MMLYARGARGALMSSSAFIQRQVYENVKRTQLICDQLSMAFVFLVEIQWRSVAHALAARIAY